MAIPLWPTTLPVQPLQEGTEVVSLRAKPIATPMEDGFIRQRRRSTTPLSEVTLAFILDEQQVQTLAMFVCETLNEGVQRFEMPVWKAGAVEPFPVRVVTIIGGAAAVKLKTVGLWTYATIPLQVRDY